jgi:hypothetical protein
VGDGVTDMNDLTGGGDNNIYLKDSPQETATANPPAEADAPETPGATAEDKDGDGKTGAEEDLFDPSEPAPPGSPVQQSSKDVLGDAQDLESNLQAAADVLPEDVSARIGEQLDDLRDKLEALDQGIENGNYNSADLSAAQAALQQLEATLMSAADGPGMDDGQANQVGVALDNLFDSLGTLAQQLEGAAEPPPFASRMYVRQWLGRKGLRVGVFARRG